MLAVISDNVRFGFFSLLFICIFLLFLIHMFLLPFKAYLIHRRLNKVVDGSVPARGTSQRCVGGWGREMRCHLVCRLWTRCWVLRPAPLGWMGLPPAALLGPGTFPVTVIPRQLLTSELVKPCTHCVLKRKKCFSTRRLLGTRHTCQNLYESRRRPARENASSLVTCLVLVGFSTRHEFQNELTTSAEVPRYFS